MGKILISPNRDNLEGPVIFLAGPTQCVADWQSDAIGYLSVNDSVHIVSPRQSREESTQFTHEELVRQIEWEQVYINKAMSDGVMLFWFAKPIANVTVPQYAQQSFFELGDILARVQTDQSVSLGIEKDFPNGPYLAETVQKKYPHITIYDNLQHVCDNALRLIRTQYV